MGGWRGRTRKIQGLTLTVNIAKNLFVSFSQHDALYLCGVFSLLRLATWHFCCTFLWCPLLCQLYTALYQITTKYVWCCVVFTFHLSLYISLCVCVSFINKNNMTWQYYEPIMFLLFFRKKYLIVLIKKAMLLCINFWCCLELGKWNVERNELEKKSSTLFISTI